MLPQSAIDLNQEAISVFTIAEIRGMIARFLKQFSFDLVPPMSLIFFPCGTDRLFPDTPRE